MYTNQLKDICNEVHLSDKIAGWGSAALPKNAPLQVFSMTFAQIVFYKEFLKMLQTFVSQKTF